MGLSLTVKPCVFLPCFLASLPLPLNFFTTVLRPHHGGRCLVLTADGESSISFPTKPGPEGTGFSIPKNSFPALSVSSSDQLLPCLALLFPTVLTLSSLSVSLSWSCRLCALCSVSRSLGQHSSQTCYHLLTRATTFQRLRSQFPSHCATTQHSL